MTRGKRSTFSAAQREAYDDTPDGVGQPLDEDGGGDKAEESQDGETSRTREETTVELGGRRTEACENNGGR